jgi:nucleoside-triphosphatase
MAREGAAEALDIWKLGHPSCSSRNMRILIEGRPGSGKTTAATRLAHLLRERKIEVQGFVTDEVRETGTRVGFRVRSFGGESAMLAHIGLPGPPRVGKYGVDLDAFERVALPALHSLPADGVVVIDELGKMELASERFRGEVLDLLDAPVTAVATVHAFRHPFTDQLKNTSGVELIKLTPANRDALPARVAERLLQEER